MTNKKWNQWKNKNLGHDDGAERRIICSHLRHETPFIGADYRICNNYYIQIDMSDGKIHGPFRDLPNKKDGCRTYRPDASVWHRLSAGLCVIVEIDGTAHRKGGEGNRTSRRNQDYKDVGISCMIIDREDCKAWEISYTERLDQLLKELLKKHTKGA